MAMNQAAAISQMRTLVAAVTGMTAVYAVSETGANKMPEALHKFPCAVLIDGATSQYILTSGQHRHTYDVRVQVFCGEGDTGDQAATALPFKLLILEKFVANVTLGNRVNSCIFKPGSGGLVGLEYPPGGGIFYTGYELTFEISEQAAATPAIGA